MCVPDCPICLSEICLRHSESAMIIIKPACNHYFHYKCWKQHYMSNNVGDVKSDCPMCRARLSYEGEILNDLEYIALLESALEDSD